MADSTKTLQVVIQAKDQASSVIKSFGSSLKGLADDARIGAAVVAAGLTAIGKYSVDAGSQLQQARIAFNTMIGDANLAGKTLSQLSDFAAKTPFTFPSIVEASQRLLAYNVEAKDLIPTITNLGNIAAGVGVDKLPQLILAFGQVKAATRLTGMELRQFTEAGVPMLDILAKQFHTTAGAVQEMITDKAVSFEDVSKALASMSGEGGRFFNLMDKQSRTFGGVVSNISDNLFRMGAAFVGVSTSGEVVAGGLFDRLSRAAEKLLSVMNDITPKVSGFMNQLLNNVPAMTAVLGGLAAVALVLAAAFISMTWPILVFIAAGAAVGATVGWIATHFEQFKKILFQFVPGVWLLVTAIEMVIKNFDKIKSVIGSVVSNFQTLARLLGDFFSGGDATIKPSEVATWSTFAQVLATIRDAFLSAGDGISAFITGVQTGFAAFTTFLSTVPAMVQSFVTSVVTYVQGLPAAIAAFLGNLFLVQIPYYIGYIIGFLTTAVPTLTTMINTFLMQLPMMAVMALLELYNAFNVWMANLNTMVINYVISLVTGFVQFLSTLPAMATTVLNNLYNAFVQKLTATWAWIQKEVSQWSNRIENFLKNLPDLIGNILEQLSSAFTSKLNAIWNAVMSWKDKVVGAFNAVVSAVNAAIDALKRGFSAGSSAGKNISFQHGGFVPGSYSQPVPAILHGGERVVPRTGVDVNHGGGTGGGVTINFSGPVSMDSDERVNDLAERITSMLGRQNELAAKGVGF